MRIFAAVVLMASVSTPALAQASHDTLSEAVDSAISNNPTLMAERKTRGVYGVSAGGVAGLERFGRVD